MDLGTVGEVLAVGGGVIAGVKGGHALWKRNADARHARLSTTIETAIAPLVAAVVANRASIDAMGKTVDSIRRQVYTNGGSTIVDKIDSLHREVALSKAAQRQVSNVASFEVEGTKGHERVSYVSHAFTRLTGLSREDCERVGWIRAVHDADKDRVGMIAAESFEDGTVMQTRYRVQNVYTDETTLVEHTGTPVYDSKQETVLGWVGVLLPVRDPDTDSHG